MPTETTTAKPRRTPNKVRRTRKRPPATQRPKPQPKPAIALTAPQTHQWMRSRHIVEKIRLYRCARCGKGARGVAVRNIAETCDEALAHGEYLRFLPVDPDLYAPWAA